MYSIQNLNLAWARAEKKISAALLVGVAAVVFADVMHRVLSRTPGKVAMWLENIIPSPVTDNIIIPVLLLGLVFLLLNSALKKRNAKNSLLKSISGTAGCFVFSYSILKFFPNGFVGAPYLALSLMLWAGMIAASSATAFSQHLTVEVGEKIWPNSIKPKINTVKSLTAGMICLFLFVLSILSVQDHYHDFIETEGGGLIPALEWPKFILLSVVPYSFFMMGIRFCISALSGTPVSPSDKQGSTT